MHRNNNNNDKNIISRSLPSLKFILIAGIQLLALLCTIYGQDKVISGANGPLSAGIAPGSPIGSAALSEVEHINIHNGHVNVNVPLLTIGGRGDASYTMTYQITDSTWTVEQYSYLINVQYPDFEDPIYSRRWGAKAMRNWNPDVGIVPPFYGPGHMIIRHTAVDPECPPSGSNDPNCYFRQVFTHLEFITSDGTTYSLFDKDRKGIWAPSVEPGSGLGSGGYVRGRVFTSDGGTGGIVTFISDIDIRDYDDTSNGNSVSYATGYLIMKNGVRYRIENGSVKWIKDRHGNTLTFTYNSASSLTKITDSLNREVEIRYKQWDAEIGQNCDQILYKGLNGELKKIRIGKINNPYHTAKRAVDLFPQLPESINTYNAPAHAIWFADGRSYRFYCNAYGEVTRIETPTGAVVTYEYGQGMIGSHASGQIGSLREWNIEYEDPQDLAIYRRVIARHLYPDGVHEESTTTYSRPESTSCNDRFCSNFTTAGYVDVDQWDSNGQLLAKTRTYFNHNQPGMDIYYGSTGIRDSVETWKGQVAKIEIYSKDLSKVMQTVENEWSGVLLKQRKTKLDNNLVKVETYNYDEYDNQIDSYEYDYGNGAQGALIRQTHTDYLKINPENSLDYTSDEIHIKGLPTETQVKNADGTIIAQTSFKYDEASYPILQYGSVTGWNAPDTAARGNVTTSKNWVNTTNTYIETHAQFDQVGNVRKTWDGKGNTSETEYAADFHYAYPTKVTSAIPDSTGTHGSNTALESTSWYDYSTGLVTSTTDANGQTTTYEYNDPLNRLTKINYPNGAWTTYGYGDTPGNLYVLSGSSLDASRYTETYKYFDGVGRVTRTLSGAPWNWIRTDTQYDALGRVVGMSNPYYTTELSSAVSPSAVWTSTSYDELNRVIEIRSPDNAVVTTSYTGNEITATDQAGKSRKSITDGLGRMTKVVEDPGTSKLNYETTYSYDVLGNLRTVSQGVQSRSFVYDSLSRLTSATNPESGTISYSYDNNGNLIKKIDARGVETNSSYDAINRVKRRWYTGTALNPATPEVNYYYEGAGEASAVANSKGQLTRVQSTVSTYRYTGFDVMGGVTGSTQTTDNKSYSMSYGYNLAGLLTSQTYPSGRVVTTSYDDLGRTSGVGGQKTGETQKSYVSSMIYAAHGGTQSRKLGNNLWEHINYNNRLQPTLIGLGTSATDSSKLQLDYGYGTTNNNGNVQSQIITIAGWGAVTQTYSYDAMNRVQWAQEDNGSRWKQTYLYDRYGNRRIDAANTTANVKPANIPTINESNNRINTGQGYNYDAAGNLTRDYLGNTYAYDGENKQVTYNGGASVNGGGSYFYDGNGNRIKKIAGIVSTIFVYNAMGQMVAEYGGQSEVNSTSYLTSDNLGSTRAVTDGGGIIKERNDFTPFGEKLTSGIGGRSTSIGYGPDTVRQKFTTYNRDIENGLDYAQARYYSSTSGRFTSVDPLMKSARLSNPQTFNRYSYVLNRPLILTDPLGLCPSDRKCEKDTKGFEYYINEEGDIVYVTETKVKGNNNQTTNTQNGTTIADSSYDYINLNLNYIPSFYGPTGGVKHHYRNGKTLLYYGGTVGFPPGPGYGATFGRGDIEEGVEIGGSLSVILTGSVSANVNVLDTMDLLLEGKIPTRSDIFTVSPPEEGFSDPGVQASLTFNFSVHTAVDILSKPIIRQAVITKIVQGNYLPFYNSKNVPLVPMPKER
jgi:RHS repeat-associated protein